MAIDINKDISYQLSINVLKALGGNTDVPFESVEEVWDEINKIYDNAGDRLDIEALIMDIRNNGLYEFYPNENADAYAPVRVNVNVPQKYTEEYVEQLGREAFNEGKIEGEEIGYQKGFEEGSDDGYQDGYSEGLDDGAEEQKALLSEVTVKENGVYEREDGYKKVYVEVDIPTFETETLSVELTENGTHTYTPTADGYSSVEVSVNVDIPEPADLHILDIEVTENKSYEYTPTDYDGWKKVNLTVSVPTGGGGGDNPLSELGYSENFINSIDTQTQRDIAYAKTFVGRLDGKSYISAFNDSNLVYAPDGDLSKLQSMNGIFKNCRALTYIPPYKTTSTLTNMASMCENCYSLKQVGKFSSTSNVTSSSMMFYNCYSLEEIPDFDYSKMTSGYLMFSSCYRIKNATGMDCSSMTTASQMFYYCKSLETVELDFPVATTMDSAFKYCSNLKSVKLTTSDKLTNCESMFYGVPNAVIEPFNTSKVTNFASMYYDSKVEYPPLLDTSSATSFYQKFRYSKVIEIPAYNTVNNTALNYTFADCSNLATIPELDCGKVTNISYMLGSSTSSSYPALTTLGGFKNLGANNTLTNYSNYFIQGCHNLTHESLMNVINGLYDRKTAGYSVITLKFGSTNMNKLTDEEKAIATAKGWSLAT